LGRHDRHIIEQCQRHGLTPQDVRVRVDGQTIASRLKNGESISSVPLSHCASHLTFAHRLSSGNDDAWH
jgi:hypothetical protein